ncbi:HAD family hydrolase [Mucilaginibacter sp. HD30]
MKRALILDLDNTIYPVSDIADDLFSQFFNLLKNDPDVDSSVIELAKNEMTRRPFQQVADEFNFSAKLKSRGIELLKNITYEKPIQPFADYHHIKSINLNKFLVTTGFTKLQYSKIKQLDIEQDFKEIYIVDPEISPKTKQDIFKELMNMHRYQPADLLIIGDDPNSEIKAALSLGIETFLFDPNHMHPNAVTTYRAINLAHVLNII